ncbi:transglycosylase SLT domain-containing protein [Nocardioides sp. HM23]|uniref:lytic transglycosylase domain-containing protein n=1 Tax=Nocardioides bizhenqiangii TaxID=3095076 RepID=UPI002ACAF628|nr:transglycosylase SLT domain-containing protein [Nocardioides sp. HM23]MDZ5620818.1 transglycosylase SLT domain-containing protein [Nocardioides sp. HM23]
MNRLLAALVAGVLLAGSAGCSEDPDDPSDTTSQHDRKSERASERKTEKPGEPGEPGEQDSTAEPSGEPLPSAPPVTAEFVPATSARELAARLTTAEDLVRDRSADEDVLQAAAFEAQLLYRQLARTPAWEQVVRSGVPERYRVDVDAHLTARRSLRSVLSTLSDELPAWRIIDPASTADLLRFYREGERTYGVSWEVLAAINLVETGFGKIRGLSTAGAQGPMQFIPSTWAAYGEGDINDPHDSILAAARYLAANGGDTAAGIESALYRYNNHPGYVAGILAYASVVQRDPRALQGLVRWQIVYLSTIGDLWLPVGYFETSPVPVRQYVREHPERHLGTATD